MIVEVDDALCVLLGRALPEGTAVRIDTPKPGWQTEPPVHAIDLFLFGLRDLPPAQTAGTHAYALSYLVTARAIKVRDEHDLLDRALRTVLANAVLGKDCFPAGFSYPDDGVRLIVTSTDPGALWTSIGVPARAGFVATVTAPFNERTLIRQ